MKKCLVCKKGELIKVEDIIFEIDGYVFVVKGERCSTCNEEFPYEEETKKMIETARKVGVWPEPLKLYRHFSRSGGGLVFRVPVDLEKQLSLSESTEVSVTKIGKKIILEVE